MSASTKLVRIEHQVREALRGIADPCSIATGVPISLVDMGLISGVQAANGHVSVNLCLTSPVCLQVSNIRDAVEKAVGKIDGITSVECIVDSRTEWLSDRMAPAVRAKLRALRPLSKQGADQRDGDGSTPRSNENGHAKHP